MANTEKPRGDVWPEFQWRLYLDGAKRRTYVGEGEIVPLGYGIAYYLPDRDVAVAMPVPLNSIVGAIRALRHWLMFPPWRDVEFQRLNAAYFAQRRQEDMDRAQQFGYRTGRQEGLREGKDTWYIQGHIDATDAIMADMRQMLETERDPLP